MWNEMKPPIWRLIIFTMRLISTMLVRPAGNRQNTMDKTSKLVSTPKISAHPEYLPNKNPIRQLNVFSRVLNVFSWVLVGVAFGFVIRTWTYTASAGATRVVTAIIIAATIVATCSQLSLVILPALLYRRQRTTSANDASLSNPNSLSCFHVNTQGSRPTTKYLSNPSHNTPGCGVMYHVRKRKRRRPHPV